MHAHRARIDGSMRLSANVPHSGASTVARIHTGCHPADLMPCSADTGAAVRAPAFLRIARRHMLRPPTMSLRLGAMAAVASMTCASAQSAGSDRQRQEASTRRATMGARALAP